MKLNTIPLIKKTFHFITRHKIHSANFTAESIKSDLLAGILVGLILIPQSLAYAQLAGLPPVYGLYASIFPVAIAVLFGSSNHLSTGPVAIVSILTATTLAPLASTGTPAYLTYAVVLALLSGILQLGLGLLKAGWLVNFLSHPVVIGFTNAAALVIASTQLGSLLGITIPSGTFFENLKFAVSNIFSEANPDNLVLAGSALCVIIALKILSPKIPGALIALIGGSVFCWWAGLDIKTIGEVGSPIPKLTMPEFHLSYIYDLITGVSLIALVGFTESIAVAQAVAAKTKQKIDPDQELIGQGLGNIASAVTGGYPVAGSLSRTSINFSNGAKTWLAGAVCAATVLLSTIFFYNYIKFTPQVLLAVVIILSVATILSPKKLINIFKINFFDGLAAVITFSATLLFAPDMEKGILTGLVFSLGYFIYRNSHPKVVFLSRFEDGFYRDIVVYNLRQCKNIAVIRLDAPLFFANARFFENKVIAYLAHYPHINRVLFLGGGISEIDATGAEVLNELIENLKDSGKKIYMANLKYPAEAMFKKIGIWESIEGHHIFPTTQIAVAEIIKRAREQGNHEDGEKCPLLSHQPRRARERASISSIQLKKIAKKVLPETLNGLNLKSALMKLSPAEAGAKLYKKIIK